MAVKDRNVEKNAKIGQKELVVAVVSATSLAGVTIYSFLPGHAFEIVRVTSWCRTVTSSISGVVKVGTRSSAAAAFAAATETVNAVSATPANNIGSKTEAITLVLTTDGTGAVTNGFVTIVYKIRPLDGQAV